ncbi:high-potential iron-sulfur protein [Leptospira sp. 96542]|nr:high-potential iron-sulfur protein [Leptospira sp. 96542]
MKKISRNKFLKRTIHFGSSFFLLGILVRQSSLTAKEVTKSQKQFPLPDGEVAVLESDPTASALGFHHDANHTDFKRFPDRKKASAKNQICKHCAQFTKQNEGWGKCYIISNGLIANDGWCSAWSKKD